MARRTTIAAFALLVAPLTGGCPSSAEPEAPGQLLSQGWGGDGESGAPTITSKFSGGPDSVGLRFETAIQQPVVESEHPFASVDVFLETNGVGAMGPRCRTLAPARSENHLSTAVQWHFDVVCAWTEPGTHYAGYVTVRIYDDGSAFGQ